MEVNFFARRKILSGTEAVALTPFRKNEYEQDEKGLVVILIPKFKKRELRFLVPRRKSEHIRITLDELGSAVWLAINGEKKVKTICQEMIDKFSEKIHPAEERILKFLSQLYTNKLISFNELLKKE
ncbi:MAG: PqqD family protein [Bacteroidota bacterium]